MITGCREVHVNGGMVALIEMAIGSDYRELDAIRKHTCRGVSSNGSPVVGPRKAGENVRMLQMFSDSVNSARDVILRKEGCFCTMSVCCSVPQSMFLSN